MPKTIIELRKKEAVELVKKGGLSTKIGLTFLKQHVAD